MAREIELLSDREQARNRLSIWAGSIMPHTIVAKELIDNEIDVVNEKGQPATKCIIKLSKYRMKLMDNGTGISTNIKEGTDKTHLWYACAKMFSSSNYKGVKESVGANGVGMTTANYTSHKFNVINFNGDNVRGYQFTDGYLNGTEESPVKETGDLVNNPLTYEAANKVFDPFFEHGFLVDVTWDAAPNEVFHDDVNIDWLVRYTKLRVGEIKSGEIELYIYEDDEFKKEIKHYIWNKDKESKNYVKSWEEKVKDYNAVIIKHGPYQIAFSSDVNMKVDPMVQGAPIKERYSITSSIKIQEVDLRVTVPFSIKFLSEEYPPYTDQTKVDIRLPYSAIGNAFEKSGDVYKHFYREAEKAYMVKVIKDSDSSTFWPSLGKPEESELIIAEGYSAVSALKAERDEETQACIALRGKISNCWNLEMTKAMRSDVVKQILNAVLYTKYKRVIIAVDADDDGGHIASLLISLFARFTNLIQEGKLFYVHTPHYLFKKYKAPLKWSDDARDCPAGYKTTTLKGLGGMSADEVGLFIMSEDTRTLVRIDWDEDAEASLDHAFSEGGESWIIQ